MTLSDPRRRQAIMAGSALLGGHLLSASRAEAQTAWPNQPVKIVVPYAPGGSTDAVARLLARKFSGSFGQPFIVENRAGANGNLGAASVATAPADGYTLMFSTTGPLSLNKLLYRATTFNPETDFTPIVLLADVPLLLVAHPTLPAQNITQLLPYLKANAGKVSFASAGTGSMGHLSALLMQRATGTSLLHVPYKGSSAAVNDLLGGVVNLSFDLLPPYLPHLGTGKVRALAVLGTQRTPLLPDVPTFIESRIDISATGWFGMAGPKGLPVDVVVKLNKAANEFLASTEGRAQLQTFSMKPIGGKPEVLAKFVQSEMEKWAPIIEPIAASVTQ
jgi:tripartite-type tricarboxylate transporter receptor subunit TctC